MRHATMRRMKLETIQQLRQLGVAHVSPSDLGFLGVLQLDTQFPRPVGDIGCAQSWPMPTQMLTVRGAFPEKVVASAASLRGLRVVEPLKKLARQMEISGAKAITTTCGFLVLLQADLQAAVKVPVVTSSLMQLPALLKTEAQVGVLTISAAKLSPEHLRAAGVARADLPRVVVQGVDSKGEFASAILGNRTQIDFETAGRDLLAAALALHTRHPTIKTVVLECANMPPYQAGLERETGLRFLSLLDDARLRKPFAA